MGSGKLGSGKLGLGKVRTLVVLAASTALAVASVTPAVAAGAPPAGVGSSSGTASLLSLALGADALALRLVGEDAQTTNDTGAGGPSALERVSPLQITSALLPALAAVSQPTVETRSSSGEDATSTPPVDLGALVAGGIVPGLVAGTIDPVALRSAVDASGAVSSASGGVRDLALVGGLLRAGTTTAGLGSTALVTDAGSVRGLQMDHLDVLDLTAILGALGISLPDLPIDVAVGLLDQLGLPVPGGVSSAALLTVINGLLDQTSAVRTQVTTLQGQIDGVQAQLTALTSQLATQQALLAACVVPGLCAPIQALVTSLTTQVDAAQAQLDALAAQVQALLDTVRAPLDQLLGILNGVLDALDGAPLLVVDNLAVGLTARAGDTLGTSVAKVVGSVGAVHIGAQSLGGLDAGATAAQLGALGDQVTSALGGILSSIDPSLGALVQVDLLDRVTSVSQSGGVTKASAAITGLRATITPPDVCGVLGRLAAVPDSLAAVLGGSGLPVPSLPVPVTDLLSGLGSTVSCNVTAGSLSATTLVNGVATALTQPARVEALSLAGAGTFAALAAPTTTPGALPVTGGDSQLGLLALGACLVGLTSRRLVVRGR